MKRKTQVNVFAIICVHMCLDHMGKSKDSHMMHKKYILRVREVAQWVKALIAQPDDLSSMPRINMVEGEIGLL